MKLKIRIDDEVYEVDVEIEDDGGAEPARPGYRQLPVASIPFAPAVAPAGAAAPVSTASDDKVCRSPIAGIVVRINVRVGQQIKVNDPMVVLEAMKMETNITAPFDGVVKNVVVAEGQAVQPQQVLVEFE
jgi:methylmalonyl-CoA carboxyltransferase 1.3S subunit